MDFIVIKDPKDAADRIKQGRQCKKVRCDCCKRYCLLHESVNLAEISDSNTYCFECAEAIQGYKDKLSPRLSLSDVIRGFGL